MPNLTKLEWMTSFAAALRVCAVAEETIAKVSEPMWHAAGLLDPEHAASEYTGMLTSAGMQERRRSWRGWPSQGQDTAAAIRKNESPPG